MNDNFIYQKAVALLILLSCFFSIGCFEMNKSYAWEVRNVNYRSYKMKLITLKTIDTQNLEKILKIIDTSSDTLTPQTGNEDYPGLFRSNDILCLNEQLLFWFSATEKSSRSIRTGGGLLGGIWEVIINNNKLELKPNNKDTLYTKNLLFPGSSPGKKFFGADVYGGYTDKKVVWGLENAYDLRDGPKMGKRINDRGPYANQGGVFIQFAGIISNSGKLESGFESQTDSDPRPDIIGETSYELTYRIPASQKEIIQEIKFTAVKNNFGPISTAYMALYLSGYQEYPMSWASSPELMPKEEGISLKNVEMNKYFRNSAVKEIYFYRMPASNHVERKYSAHTPEGRGQILCLGSPENFIQFLCGYPTNDYIPKVAYDEYMLELSDNQAIPKYGKFHSLNYKLINSPNKSVTLNQGQEFTMIMRYKLIDASMAVEAVKEREKKNINSN